MRGSARKVAGAVSGVGVLVAAALAGSMSRASAQNVGFSYRTEATVRAYGWVRETWGEDGGSEPHLQRTWIRDGELRVELGTGGADPDPEQVSIVDFRRDTVVVLRPRDGEATRTKLTAWASRETVTDPAGGPPVRIERTGERGRISGFDVERVLLVAEIPDPESDAGVHQIVELWLSTDSRLGPLRRMQSRLLEHPGGGGIVDGTGFDLATVSSPYREALELRRLEAALDDLEGVWLRSRLHLVETVPGTELDLPLALSLVSDPGAGSDHGGHAYLLEIDALRRDVVLRGSSDVFESSGAGDDAPPAATGDSLRLFFDRYIVDLVSTFELELPEGVEAVEVYEWGEFGLRWRDGFLVQGRLYGGLEEDGAAGEVPEGVLRDARSACVGEAPPPIEVACPPAGPARPVDVRDFWDPVLAFGFEQRVEEPGAEPVTRSMGPFHWIPLPPGPEGGRGLLLEPGWGVALRPDQRTTVRALIENVTPPPPAGIVSTRTALVDGDVPIRIEPDLRRNDGFLHRGTGVEVVGPSVLEARMPDAFDIEWHRIEYAGTRYWMTAQTLAFLEDWTAEAALFVNRVPDAPPGDGRSPRLIYYLDGWEGLTWVVPGEKEEVLFSPKLHHYAVLDTVAGQLRVVDPYGSGSGPDPEDVASEDAPPFRPDVLLEARYLGEPAWELTPDEVEVFRYRAVVGGSAGEEPVVEERTFRPGEAGR